MIQYVLAQQYSSALFQAKVPLAPPPRCPRAFLNSPRIDAGHAGPRTISIHACYCMYLMLDVVNMRQVAFERSAKAHVRSSSRGVLIKLRAIRVHSCLLRSRRHYVLDVLLDPCQPLILSLSLLSKDFGRVIACSSGAIDCSLAHWNG